MANDPNVTTAIERLERAWRRFLKAKSSIEIGDARVQFEDALDSLKARYKNSRA